MTATRTTLLDQISSPRDVAALAAADLPALAGELRALLIHRVSATGGHLGASLGVVELTIAVHRVFDSPRDVVIFDTGHQCYPHKILTGRAAGFDELRKPGGLAGYPSRAESEHDWVENSHASVSLAWADGIAKAWEVQGRADRKVVVVVGDGALTGGVAWEGLNNLGGAGRDVVVVLNDNGRSYDPTVGGLAHHLAQLRTGRYTGRNLFETMGLTYLGPVDGHDTEALCAALHVAADHDGPTLVHAVTAKGKGFLPAERDEADRMHACGVIDPTTGHPRDRGARSWTDVFADRVAALARNRPDVVALTAGMRLPTGLGRMSAEFPGRVFDSGIAEQHLLASAAGMAAAGLRPVVCLYSTFLHRAYDQLLMDIALHSSPVTLVLDRAGITGPDGPSHHGMWDLLLLAGVPGMRVGCPRDPARLAELLTEAVATPGPAALRFPKSTAGPDIPALSRVDGIDILHRSPGGSSRLLLVSAGPLAQVCLDAAPLLETAGIGVTVADPRWCLPVGSALVDLATRHHTVVSVEDGITPGGIGTRLADAVARTGAPARCHALGLPTRYLPHGPRSGLLDQAGLTGPHLADTCLTLIKDGDIQNGDTTLGRHP